MPEWFDDEVTALEKRWKQCPTARPNVLFYGSSTFTLWHDMSRHFPAYNVVNHAFGGSTMPDCLEYFDRLVAVVRPSAIILYAGDNDLDNGRSPERVIDDLESFLARKREMLGDTPLGYASIKVSPARLHIMHAIAYTNRLAERRLAGQPDVRYLDVTRRMVGGGMEPWLTCFSEDPLHMNAHGYRIWGKSLSEFLTDWEGGTVSLIAREPLEPPIWASCTGLEDALGGT
jgi:lysophospholipase L1-like esterase